MEAASVANLSKQYLDSLAMGTNWLEPDSFDGVTEKLDIEAVERGELREEYDLPDFSCVETGIYQVIEEWADGLNDLQLATALFDFHERWTWDSGTDMDLAIFETLQREFTNRKRQPGDMTYNTKDGYIYAFDGRKWIQAIGPNDQASVASNPPVGLDPVDGE